MDILSSGILSNGVDIFPLAKSSGETSLTSRLFYEQNIANLIRQVVDKEGFIISGGTLNTNTLAEDLIFNLYGYWVRIKEGTDLSNVFNGDAVYAHIVLDNTPVQEIVEVTLSSTAPTYEENQSLKSLLLFIKDSNGWKVNSDAFYKVNCSSVDFRGFNPQLLNISSIDGKPQSAN